MSYIEIKCEPDWTEEMFAPCEYSVKEELVWQDSETGFAGAWGGLDADHEVKRELAPGPTALQLPDNLFSTPDIPWTPCSDFHSVWSEPCALTEGQTYSNVQATESIVLPATHTGSKLFSCYVRLERCPVLSELTKRLANKQRKMCPVCPPKETSHKSHYKPKAKKNYKLKMFQRTVEPDLMEYTYRVNKSRQNSHWIYLRGAGTSNATLMNGNAYVCKVCMEEFEDQSRLDEHAQTHKGEIQYVCKVCERQFAKISYFRAHVCTKYPISCKPKIKIIDIANNNFNVTTNTNTGNIDPGGKSHLEKKTHNSKEKKPVKAKNPDSKLKGKAKNCNTKLKIKSESGLKKDDAKTQNVKTPKAKNKKTDKKLKKTITNLDLMKFAIVTKNLDAMKFIKVKMSNSDKKHQTKSDPGVKKARRQINQMLQKLKKDPLCPPSRPSA